MTNGTPKYMQIAQELREAIKAGTYRPGEPIPQERDLADHYDVARATVRAAIGLLRDEGLLVAVRKRGTIVRLPPVPLTLSRLAPNGRGGPWQTACANAEPPVVGDMLMRGVTHEPADDNTASKLKIEPGQTVVRRSRHATADGQVAQIQDAWSPLALVEGTPLADQERIEGGVYGMWARIGHVPTTINEIVEARSATPDETSIMRLGPSVPVLVIERVTRDQNGLPFELLTVVADASRSKFVYENLSLPPIEPRGV